MQAPVLTLKSRRAGVHLVLEVGGEIDISTAEQVRAAADAAIRDGGQNLVIDLRDVEFMDAAGVHLLRGLRALQGAGVRCQMIDGVPGVLLVLALAGETDVLDHIDPALVLPAERPPPGTDAPDRGRGDHAHHCPHCLAVVARTDDAFLPAMRCPRCRLVIGPGRSKTPANAALAEQSMGRGSLAGVMAGDARRAQADPGDPVAIGDDLRTVADIYAVDVTRLRMTDYDEALSLGIVTTDLAVVLATFGAWKAARAAAAVDRDSVA